MVRKSILSYLKNPSLWLGFLSLVGFFLSQKVWTYQPPARSAYLTPPELKHFTFGYNEAIADSLWIRAIQDFDFCNQKINEQDCVGQSWLYHMLDQITELS